MNALILHTSLPSFKTYGELRAPSPKPPRCDRSSKDATAISLSGLRRAAPAAVWLHERDRKHETKARSSLSLRGVQASWTPAIICSRLARPCAMHLLAHSTILGAEASGTSPPELAWTGSLPPSLGKRGPCPPNATNSHHHLGCCANHARHFMADGAGTLGH